MNRVKALYRSWSIPCGGASVYAPRHRKEWLSKITEPGVRRRAELFYQQLDGLQKLRQEARCDSAESLSMARRSCSKWISLYRSDSSRLLIALMQTPVHWLSHRKTAMGVQRFGSETSIMVNITTCRVNCDDPKRPLALRGLNQNHNHDLKSIFKGAAARQAGAAPRVRFVDFYSALLAQGMKSTSGAPTLASQDRDDHFARLEERSVFPRPTAKTAGRFECLGKESVPAAGISACDVSSDFFETFGFEGEYPPEA